MLVVTVLFLSKNQLRIQQIELKLLKSEETLFLPSVFFILNNINLIRLFIAFKLLIKYHNTFSQKRLQTKDPYLKFVWQKQPVRLQNH